jgi:hypothetical protein
MTEKGFLTPEERDLLRRKQCNSINRAAYVCCSGESVPEATTPETAPSRGNMGQTYVEPARLRSRLPKPPVCGAGLHDKVCGTIFSGVVLK